MDDTERIVHGMQKSNCDFPILYKKTVNSGKHRAWNQGIEMASGELFVGCDSDDNLSRDALEITDIIEKTITGNQKKDFAGVCGLRAFRKNGCQVGSTFTGGISCQGISYMDMTFLETSQNNVHGDKSEVIYTSVWKRYKYHEFEGENFLTEATALNRMAEDGLKVRYFNHVIKEIEYLADGLTANSFERFTHNPKGWGLYLGQLIKYGELTGQKKCFKVWEYYDSNIKKLSEKEIAENLSISVGELKRLLLAEKIIKRTIGRE